MKKMRLTLNNVCRVLMVVLIPLIHSCEFIEDLGDNQSVPLASETIEPFFNVLDAKQLFVLEEQPGIRELWKMTESGELVPATIEWRNKESGDIIPLNEEDDYGFNVFQIFDLDEYLLLHGGLFYQYREGDISGNFSNVLVEIETGNFYGIEGMNVLNQISFFEPTVRKAKDNDWLYFIEPAENAIMKLDYSVPDDLMIESHVEGVGIGLTQFYIDDSGDVIYVDDYFNFGIVSNSEIVFELEEQERLFFWIGPNEMVYVSPSGMEYVLEVDPTNGDTMTVATELLEPYREMELSFWSEYSATFYLENSTVLVSPITSYALEIFETDFSTNAIPIPDISYESPLTIAETRLFYASGSNVYVFNAMTLDTEILVEDGAYEFVSLKYLNDVLYFGGIRLSDDQGVFGTISLTGEMQLIDDQLGMAAVDFLDL